MLNAFDDIRQVTDVFECVLPEECLPLDLFLRALREIRTQAERLLLRDVCLAPLECLPDGFVPFFAVELELPKQVVDNVVVLHPAVP
jgi:hypothetical protein